MNRAEWMAGTDSYRMLQPCRRVIRDDPRKGRLFAVACCDRIRHLMVDLRSRAAVDVTRRYADHAATFDELQGAAAVAKAAHLQAFGSKGKIGASAEWAAEFACDPDAWFAASRASNFAYVAAGGGLLESGPERAAQADLLRCIFGPLPFAAANIAQEVPRRSDAAVHSLAQAIYDSCAFDRMPELGERLEGRGCTDADILAHCRGPGPHVRGCWVIDLLLGKS